MSESPPPHPPHPPPRAVVETSIPCSDDFRHPDGSVVTLRLLPHLFFGPRGLGRYPRSSPLRCHACRLPFAAPPLFIPTSIQFHPPTVPGRMTVEVTGHYCSAGCRNRALDELDGVLGETYRMFAVRADLEAFGAPMDYATALPAARDLEPFGGRISVQEFERARAASSLRPEQADAVPADIRWVYRLRGARETWYGKLEGGEGRRAILQALAEAAAVAPESAPAVAPESAPAPAASPKWDPPARLSDPEALADFLSSQPGSPRLVVGGGRALATWPRAQGRLCQWCAGPVCEALPVLVPSHRDLLNSIHLEGNFCSPGCGFAWLTAERRGLSPTRHHERIGLHIWLCTTVLGVPIHARPRTAPHYLELDEFGGDLTRAEFDAQEAREDLFTSLEGPPAVSRRMLGNYTRPGVVCDLTRLGTPAASGPVVLAEPAAAAAAGAAGAAAAAPSYAPSLPGMYEELIRDCPPPAPTQPAPKRKGALIA
jgi:hypothetical protein